MDANKLAVCFSASRIDTNGALPVAVCGGGDAAPVACGAVAPVVNCLNYAII
jgi:hypothetical protein